MKAVKTVMKNPLLSHRCFLSHVSIVFCFVRFCATSFIRSFKNEYFSDKKSIENGRSKSWTWDVANENDNVVFGIYDGPDDVQRKDLRQWNDVNRAHGEETCHSWSTTLNSTKDVARLSRCYIHTHTHTRQNNTWTWNRVRCGRLFKIYEGKRNDAFFGETNSNVVKTCDVLRKIPTVSIR